MLERCLGFRDKNGSDHHHSRIQDPGIALLSDSTVWRDCPELHEHVLARNPYLVKNKPAVVFTVVAELRTKVTALNTWHPLVSALLSYLHNERRNPVVMVFDDQSGHHKRVVGVPSHLTWPPLGRSYGRRVNYKLLSGFIVGGCCFQLSNVRTMTKLCLAVATNQIQVQGLLQPFLFLLICRKLSNALHEHCLMESNHRLAMEVEQPEEVWFWHLHEVHLTVFRTFEIQIF